ncbi:MAG: hypothetical protein RKP46_10220 [Candidatus Accumulibacter sp.]|uniref:hypothetical protein n=1 Tax=Accumulibacter sp. TaxID=2053492 RepID=UPI00287B362B|nr:hypothetical protein [Accumulibacter sp.]MDS4014716.1 hypothetical protein [Accumulibacter sp.]
MILFDETAGVEHLDAMRSMCIGLALFFCGVGGYLLTTGLDNGGWMLLAGAVSGFAAWDAHKTLKRAEDPKLKRRKLGY